MGSAADHFKKIGDLERENGSLKIEIASLNEKLAAAQAAVPENESLRQALDFVAPDHYSLVSTNIIGSDPNTSVRSLIIDRGTESGISVGSAVVAGNGILIGKIVSSGPGRSTVLLLTDPRCVIAAMVSGRPEANGVAKGELGFVVTMSLVPQSAKIESGDLVVTTGREKDIARGLVLGTVESVKSEPSEPFSTATVVPVIDPMSLTVVRVMVAK